MGCKFRDGIYASFFVRGNRNDAKKALRHNDSLHVMKKTLRILCVSVASLRLQKKYIMNKNIIFCLCFCFLSLSLLNSCNTSKKAKATAQKLEIPKDPYITFDNPDHDFGTMKAGEQKTHVYIFTNTNAGDVTLELVSGCHCTDLEYDEGKTYKPGETGTIKATFDSNREEERGELNKTIDILLENTDPKTGYQIIKEVRFKLVLED